MTMSTYLLIAILLSGVVTLLLRVIPFALISRLQLSETFVKWLSFIPITLFTALVVDGLIEQTDGAFGYIINIPFVITVIPTIIIAFYTRSLTITIVSGIVLIAILRIFL